MYSCLDARFKISQSEVICNQVVSKEQSMGQQKILLRIEPSLCSSNPDFLLDSAQSALKLRIYFSTSYFSVPFCMQYNGNYYQLENFSFPQLNKTLRFIFFFWFSFSYTKYFLRYIRITWNQFISRMDLDWSSLWRLLHCVCESFISSCQNFLSNYRFNIICVNIWR